MAEWRLEGPRISRVGDMFDRAYSPTFSLIHTRARTHTDTPPPPPASHLSLSLARSLSVCLPRLFLDPLYHSFLHLPPLSIPLFPVHRQPPPFVSILPLSLLSILSVYLALAALLFFSSTPLLLHEHTATGKCTYLLSFSTRYCPQSY